MAINPVKATVGGLLGLGGATTAACGTYYLITEERPNHKELEKWTKTNKCTITSLEIKGSTPEKTINFADLDETISSKLLTWLKQDTNKNTLECNGTETKSVSLTTTDQSSFTKKS